MPLGPTPWEEQPVHVVIDGGATASGPTSVTVDGQPIHVRVDNLPATQPVSGTVTVSNLPATQTVHVDNPTAATTSVSVSNLPATQPVSGTVAVSNHPTSVSVSNLPATQPVSGTISVSNFPTATSQFNEYVYNGSAWEPKLTANVFKTITLTASGNTAIWTPTSGKRFRLMGYNVQITNGALLSTAGTLNVTFLDGSTALGIGYSTYLQALLSSLNAGNSNSTDIDLGNGILSAAVNNILYVNLSAAVTGGLVRINLRGIEV